MGDFVGVPSLFPQGPDPLEMWRNAYSQPAASPDDGKVQSLAQTYEADPEYVRDNLIDFQSRFAAQQLYSQTFKSEYPTLSRNLVTPQFVSRVRDDMGNIIETEGWWNQIANAYQIARDTVEVGNFSTRAMLEGRDLYPYERRKIEQRSRLQRAHMQSEPGFLASAAELAGTMQETLAYSLGAGYVAGAVSGPAAPVVAPLAAGITAFATSFNLEAGNLYADLVMEGYTPAQARDIAMSYGAVISGFEAVGLKLAGQPIKQLGRELIKKRGRDLLRRETAGRVTGEIFKDYALGILGEATTEGVQEVIGEFGKARASQIYRPQNLYEPEYLETFGQAFVHTAKGMVVLGGVPSAIRLANDNVKVATANYDYEKAKEAAEIRGRSNARDAQRQVDAESGETTTLNSSYYIRAQDFKSALSEAVETGAVTEQQVRDTIEANRPGLMARIDEAAERDGEVELSKTEWEDAFDNTKFRDTALRHTAYEENGLTNFEVKESEAIRDRIIQERGDKAEQELQDMEEFERQLRDVRQDVTKQLREEMKGMDAAQTLTASAYSSMIIGFIRRAALQQNITPQEFYQKHFPRIVQQRLEGQQRGDAYQAGQQPSGALDIFDAKDGIGAVPFNQNVDYRGFAVQLTPSQFRSLVPAGVSGLESRESIGKSLREGKKVGQPFLSAKWDDEAKVWRVGNHEGRSRSDAISDVFGSDALMEVHIFPTGGLRAKDITDEMRQAPVVPQDGGAPLNVLTPPARPDTLESGTFDQDADYTFTEGDYRPEVVAWAKEQFGDRVAPNGKPVYQNFVRWFGDSQVVDGQGRPLIVYHGTTRDFTGKFRLGGASVESDLGAGIYLSSRAQDAGRNYGSPEGPDVKQRIELLAEQIDSKAYEGSYEDALAEAQAEILQNQGMVIPAVVRMRNPLVIGGERETQFDYVVEFDDDGDLIQESGSLLDLVDAVREVGGSGVIDLDVEAAVQRVVDAAADYDGVKAGDVVTTLKEVLQYGEDEAGKLAASEFVRQVFAEMGFDGIIDTTVAEKFPGMSDMPADTKHYVAFSPNQIKSTQNQGDFSADPGILYSKEGEATRPNVVRAYHGTAGRFEDFNKAVRDALAKWDVVRKELQADIDKAQAKLDKASEAERRFRTNTYDQLESDKAKLEQERDALEDETRELFGRDAPEKTKSGLTKEQFFEKRKEIFRRRDRLEDQANTAVRNSPQRQDVSKGLRSLEEAREAYREAEYKMAPDFTEEMLSDFFSERFIGATDPGYGPRGIYFTEDIEQAKAYTRPKRRTRDRRQNVGSGASLKPTIYTVDIDTSEFYDYRNPVSEIEDEINATLDREFSEVLRLQLEPEVREARFARARRDILEKAGYKGAIFKMPTTAGGAGFSKTGEEIVAFDTSVIQEVSSPDGVLFSRTGPSDQQRVLGQAEVEGGNAIKKILLDPNAKPTTLMHELMHWNLEIMATVGLDIESKLAQEGYEATMLEAQMLGDIQRLLKWSGFEGTLTEWRAMSIDQRREFHEAIAVSFERYLYEGVAPSRELRGAFRRLLDYMRGKFEDLVLGYQRDYEREFGRELPGMNDEVRAIFGRMMSAERDVQAFFDESELDAMLTTREEWVNSGRSEEEYDEYEQEFKDAMYESKAELTQRRMKEVGTFTNAINLVAQKQRAELKRIRAQIRQEEEAAIRLQPVYQLRSWMKSATFQTEAGPQTQKFYEEDGKTELSRSLDRDMVEAINPDLAKKLSNRRMLKKGGMSLDAVRNMFGFESNEAMLQALADSRNLADEITHRTDQRLLNEHTDLMDPVVQQENIHAAVHNKIREKVMQRELKYLLNNGRSNRVEMQAMADAAKQIIESTPTGDVDIASYSRAAARARKKMLKALKDGDMEAAKFAKRQEMLNEALVREGMKVRTEVRSLVKMNKRVFNKRSDKALAEAGYDVTVVKAIRALLTRLGIGNVDFDPAQALNAFENEDPEFFDEVSGDIDYFLKMDIAQPRVGDRRRPMEHLLVGDVRKLRSLSRRMMKRAKDKMSAKIGERKENIETLRQEAQATMESNVEVKRDADDKSIFGRIRDYFSDVIRFEHLFRRIDGGKAGIWTQMFRQVKDAANKYRQELRQFLAKDAKTGKGFDFEGKIRALDLKIPGGARSLTMNLPSAGTSGRAITIGRNGKHVKTELIHLAMHYYGNSSNRRRLAGGYAGLDATPDQITQVEIEIKRFLDEQVRQGVLTRKDFAFMQSIFDHFSGQDMLGRAQKVMKDLRGYEMTEVKGEEFAIQFPGQSESTTFAGGYIPIRFREAVRQEDKGQGVTEEDASLEQQARRMLGFLPSFTKERVTGDVDRELYLGLHQLASHAAEVYRFINMAQPIDSVSRVLSGRSLEQSFRARFGDKAYNHLQGWLKRSAFQRFERGQDSGAGSLLLRLSRNANMSIMFLNIGNTLQNYAGLLIPMRRVGKRRLISSLIHSTFNRKLSDEVAAKSPEMKARLKRQIFDIYNTQNQILTSEDSAWRRLQSWADKYAYVLQQITQNHVDVAVWQAAYNQETEAALKENVSAEAAEARAIAHADSVVRQSQMAGEKEDLSDFESGGSLARALFPFKSWFINWLNNAATQNRLDMKQEDRSRAAAVASTYIYMLMLPAMMAQAATELARGDDFDDEDDGFGDDLTELFFRSQIDQVTGGMPVVGDFTRLAINNWLDDEYWNNRYPVAPWARALERLVRTPLKFGEEPAGTTLDMAAQMASIMGVPASGAFRRLSLIGDEIAGELESASTYDFVRGAVTGQRSDLQRLSQ